MIVFECPRSFQIKAAWFTVLLTLIDRAPTFLEDYHKKVCTSIFTNFDDDDTNVLPLVWETTLHSCDIIKVRTYVRTYVQTKVDQFPVRI